MHSRLDRPLKEAIFLGALLTIPLTVAQEQGFAGPLVVAGDWIVWAVFLIDYIVNIAKASDRWDHARRRWLDLAIVILSFPLAPALLALIRLARLTRLVRILRLMGRSIWGLRALRAILGRSGMVHLTAVTAFLIIAGGACLSALEPNKGGFWDGVWWAIVTVTTIGYGDISPTTVWGRLIAVALMLAGLGLLSTLAASITAYFVEQDAGASDLKHVVERLDRIEDLLRQLRRDQATDGAATMRSDRRESFPDGKGFSTVVSSPSSGE